MNEALIQKIVQLIMSDPGLREQFFAHQPVEETARQDLLILLNYAPDMARALEKLATEREKNYRISVLGADSVKHEQLILPAGMRWISCSEAINHRWQRVILPTCSANTLAKIALGIRDTAVCELAGRAISEGVPVELVTDYLGFTAETPFAYRRLYASYAARLREYGVAITDQTGHTAVLDAGFQEVPVRDGSAGWPHPSSEEPHWNAPVRDYATTAVICWEGKLITEQDAGHLPEESVIRVAKKAIISPLAKDKLRQRRIEIVREMEV